MGHGTGWRHLAHRPLIVLAPATTDEGAVVSAAAHEFGVYRAGTAGLCTNTFMTLARSLSTINCNAARASIILALDVRKCAREADKDCSARCSLPF